MVCPHCHSKEIIAVQDQHFCISCGQMVPEEAATPSTTPAARLAVDKNGLPAGIKILPLTTIPADKINPSPLPKTDTTKAATTKRRLKKTTPAIETATTTEAESVIKPRRRLGLDAPATEPKVKKRRPGRPKAGRLDVPVKDTVVVATPSSRRLNDLVPRKATPATGQAAAPDDTAQATPVAPPPTEPAQPQPEATTQPITAQPSLRDIHHPIVKNSPQAHQPHRVGVAPLHYRSVLATSLRAQFRAHHIGLAALAHLAIVVVIGYSTWLILQGGLTGLAHTLASGNPKLIAEGMVLTILYYIGHSTSSAAIIYGVGRDADHRPVPASLQVGVSLNTFAPRLRLDLIIGLLECLVITGITLLVVFGGNTWPVNVQTQTAILFTAFLGLLYVFVTLGLIRNLAVTALTLSGHSPWATTKLSWKLFKHRPELLGLRFLVSAVELILVGPVALLAIGLVYTAPASLHLIVAFGVGILAWVAGALLGSGTATWWTTLYRKLVQIEYPDNTLELLSGTVAAPARRLPLIVVIALTTFLLAAALATPWLSFL